MTVSELIEILKEQNPGSPVYVPSGMDLHEAESAKVCLLSPRGSYAVETKTPSNINFVGVVIS